MLKLSPELSSQELSSCEMIQVLNDDTLREMGNKICCGQEQLTKLAPKSSSSSVWTFPTSRFLSSSVSMSMDSESHFG